ncbi:MAG: hypothetical protein OXT65_00780 [Alphaproteobacteria bacterium]|nr:hypothetical protein [Alphaproteobacteria bacterium]
MKKFQNRMRAFSLSAGLAMAPALSAVANDDSTEGVCANVKDQPRNMGSMVKALWGAKDEMEKHLNALESMLTGMGKDYYKGPQRDMMVRSYSKKVLKTTEKLKCYLELENRMPDHVGDSVVHRYAHSVAQSELNPVHKKLRSLAGYMQKHQVREKYKSEDVARVQTALSMFDSAYTGPIRKSDIKKAPAP